MAPFLLLNNRVLRRYSSEEITEHFTLITMTGCVFDFVNFEEYNISKCLPVMISSTSVHEMVF
jgi:hypothetical protein